MLLAPLDILKWFYRGQTAPGNGFACDSGNYTKRLTGKKARDVCVVRRHSSACCAVVPDGINAGTKYRKNTKIEISLGIFSFKINFNH